MGVTIKSAEEIEKMRVAGRLAADVLHMIEAHVEPGVTTQQLNDICHDFMVNQQAVVPAPLNYRGFPRSICTSVNHVVCHGIPAEKNQHRHYRNQGRLPWRYQSHVPGRQTQHPGSAYFANRL
jgi:methionine aminopeptidase